MRILPFAPVLFSAFLPLYSASISVSTYCDPLTTQTNTSTSSSCSGSAPDGSLGGTDYVSVASAQASASFALLSDGFRFNASAHGQSYSQNFALQPLDVDGNGKVSITDTIDTAGPARAGFVEVTGTANGVNGGAGGGGGDFSLGSPVGGGGTSVQCGGLGTAFSCYTGREIPIELGEPFYFSLEASADGPGCALCDDGDGAINLYFTFAFYEANGTTPVSVFEAAPPATPEPATSFLMALGLLALFARRVFCSPIKVEGSRPVAATYRHINIRPTIILVTNSSRLSFPPCNRQTNYSPTTAAAFSLNNDPSLM